MAPIYNVSTKREETKMTRKEYLQEALNEMKGYERNWSFMTAAQKRDIGCTKKELQRKIREYEKELKTL